jgi:hypothetical protein
MKINLVTVFTIACCGALVAQSSLAAAANLRGYDIGLIPDDRSPDDIPPSIGDPNQIRELGKFKQNKKFRLKREEKARQKRVANKKQAARKREHDRQKRVARKKQAARLKSEREKKNKNKKLFR